MGSIFKSPKLPPAPVTPTRENSPGVGSAAASQAALSASRKGRKSTILGGGIGDENTKLKTLLGK